MAKCFNMAATQEVKSQLETFHLLFRLPRYLCSREFKRLALKSELRKIVSPDKIKDVALEDVVLTSKTPAETYLERQRFDVPTPAQLEAKHPLSGLCLWQHILKHGLGLDASNYAEVETKIQDAWVAYLRRLSWWSFTRIHRCSGRTLLLRPRLDIVVVSPAPPVS